MRSANLFVFATLASGCVSEPAVTAVDQALEGALADTTHSYSVGYCENTNGTCDKDSAHCTASLIAPNLVITARHCVDHGLQVNPVLCNSTFLDMFAIQSMRLTTHPDPHNAFATPLWYTVNKLVTPAAPELCANDIALLILDTNIPASEATPAALDINRTITTDTVAIVGRGALDVKLVEIHPGVYAPEIVDDGNYIRRIAENIPVLCQPDQMCTIPVITDPMFTAHANHLVVGPAVAPGDSGSGIVAQRTINNPTPVILAVTSIEGWATPTQPNSTFGVHVAKHADLIRAVAQEAATTGGYPLPDWVTGTPSGGGGSGSDAGVGSDSIAPKPDDGGCATTHPSLLIALALLLVRSRRAAYPRVRRAVPRRRKFDVNAAALCAAWALVSACASSLRNTGDDDGTDSGTGSEGPGNGDSCSDAAKKVNTIDANNQLSTFDATTKTFHDLGALTCTTTVVDAQPYSMGIDRSATAYVLYETDELFCVDTTSLICTKTAWTPQLGLGRYGMGFSTDTVGGLTDTLFVAGGGSLGPTSTFAKLDLTTMMATSAGTIGGWPELTGTGNAELWGFFPDEAASRVERLDKATGAGLTTYQAPALAGETAAWAFVFWGGDFWIFLQKSGETATTIYQMNSMTGAITGSTPFPGRSIVGAGVSTCAPTVLL